MTPEYAKVIERQARLEIAGEDFAAAVEAAKVRIRERRTRWFKWFPWSIAIVRRDSR